jgi:hypothetical protein
MHKSKLAIRVRAAVNVECAELRLDRLQQILPDLIEGANLQSQEGKLQDLPNVSALLDGMKSGRKKLK